MPLLQPETMTLGDTTFTVGCLPATVGWDLSAKVANLLATTNIQMPSMMAVPPAADADPGVVASANAANVATAVAVVRALMAVPAPQVKEIRTALFEYVEFTNARATTPQKLAGAEDMAFNGAGMSSADIWQVLVAAFRVNFTEYWTMIRSLLPARQNISPSTPGASPAL